MLSIPITNESESHFYFYISTENRRSNERLYIINVTSTYLYIRKMWKYIFLC